MRALPGPLAKEESPLALQAALGGLGWSLEAPQLSPLLLQGLPDITTFQTSVTKTERGRGLVPSASITCISC